MGGMKIKDTSVENAIEKFNRSVISGFLTHYKQKSKKEMSATGNSKYSL